MALPKLNNVPQYETVIPSTQEKVRFRPYLVKEEKVLMLAMESQDQQQALNAVVDTIDSCVENGVDRNKLTTFDVEYLFTRIRAKSVGETTKVSLKCSECETPNEVVIPVEEIKIDVPKVNTRIELTDAIAVNLRWPRYNDILDLSKFTSQTEMTFKMILRCIDTIESGEERIMVKDEPESEVLEFIESLSGPQFDKIREFVDAMPQLKHKVEFKCGGCTHDNTLELQGMNDFL